ncbi:hypothetical protein CCAX7_37050 [Capsulimonas corticalis]|uniref:Uncharacterized protein n=1 Tax=Capsulimonas corticalis TaxID=2219043 RepID=A0A402D1C5_9BACT|nr:hypothetical protein [Capsulimonas corticalis]BDI31654.1 hypothetical protein CCAX7_37050 [Capsulimonas corticalis]
MNTRLIATAVAAMTLLGAAGSAVMADSHMMHHRMMHKRHHMHMMKHNMKMHGHMMKHNMKMRGHMMHDKMMHKM